MYLHFFFFAAFCAISGLTDGGVVPTLVILGPTGAGKSSLVNLLSDATTNIAKEGHTYDSETHDVAVYSLLLLNSTSASDGDGAAATSFKLLDTPGLQDTRGYADTEIVELIKAALLTSAQTVEELRSTVSGAILMFDATQTRVRLGLLVESAIQMFGTAVLERLVLLFNKKDQISEAKQTAISEFCIQELSAIYDRFGIRVNHNDNEIGRRVIFLDTKGSKPHYQQVFLDSVLNRDNIAGALSIEPNDIVQQVNDQFAAELNDDANYKIWTEEIPKSAKKTRYITTDVQTPYNYECNCHRYCARRFLGICTRRKTACGTCVGTKPVPTQLLKEYVEHWIEYKPRKELKNSREYLKAKAKLAVSERIRAKVYRARNERCKDEL